MVIFDDCEINFGNVVKYRFNYSNQGAVLNMHRVEMVQQMTEIPKEDLSVGFTQNPIIIGREKDAFLRIESMFLSRV